MNDELDLGQGLRNFVQNQTPRLFELAGHHLGWGKDGRPIPGASAVNPIGRLTLKIGEAVGLADRHMVAIGIQLLGAFFEIHSDIQEGSMERDNRESLWMHCGPAQALNIGDGMYALGRMALLEMVAEKSGQERFMKPIQIFDTVALKKCEGTYAEIELKDTALVEVDEYIRIVTASHGSLSAAAIAVTVAASGIDADLEKLFAYGTKVGLIKRVEAENRVFTDPTETVIRGEFAAKRKPLAVVLAMQNNSKTMRALGLIYFKRTLDKDTLTTVCKTVVETGALRESQAWAEKLRRQASDLLSACQMSMAESKAISNAAEEYIGT